MQVEPPQHNRWQGIQVDEGTLQGRGSEQGANEVVAGDLAGTAAVRGARAAKAGSRLGGGGRLRTRRVGRPREDQMYLAN